jgi:hypothetical protein
MKPPPDREITPMITGMRLREFFARLAPAKIGLIARDCGVAAAEDRVDALVAYSQNYGLGVIHWRVRYPELAQDRWCIVESMANADRVAVAEAGLTANAARGCRASGSTAPLEEQP